MRGGVAALAFVLFGCANLQGTPVNLQKQGLTADKFLGLVKGNWGNWGSDAIESNPAAQPKKVTDISCLVGRWNAVDRGRDYRCSFVIHYGDAVSELGVIPIQNIDIVDKKNYIDFPTIIVT